MDVYYFPENPERKCRICGHPVKLVEYGHDEETGFYYEVYSCQSPTHNYVYKIEEDNDEIYNRNDDEEEE